MEKSRTFCKVFYSLLNNGLTSNTWWVENASARSEVLFKTARQLFEVELSDVGCTELVKSLTTNNWKFVINEDKLRFYVAPHGLVSVCTVGTVFTADGQKFGIFKQLFYVWLQHNTAFKVKSFLSKVVSNDIVTTEGKTEDDYFEDVDLN